MIEGETRRNPKEWCEHCIEVVLCGLCVQFDFGFAEHGVQAFLHHLKADAAVLRCDAFTDDTVGDSELALVECLELIDKDVGIDEVPTAHSSRLE